MRLALVLPLLLAASAALAAPSIKAPPTASVGAQLSLEATGAGDGHDFVTVVPKGSPEGAYDQYVYVKPGKLLLQLPGKPGDYELRVCAAASPYKTLARQALRIEGATATVKAPAALKAGAQFEVAWTGPNNPRDYVTIGNAEQQVPRLQVHQQRQPAENHGAGEARGIRSALHPGPGRHHHRDPEGDGGRDVRLRDRAGAGGGGRQGVRELAGPGNPRDYLTIVKAGCR